MQEYSKLQDIQVPRRRGEDGSHRTTPFQDISNSQYVYAVLIMQNNWMNLEVYVPSAYLSQ